MTDLILPWKGVFILALSLGLTACGTAYKEKTAPCKRPAGIAAYGPGSRLECGPLTAVNPDSTAAIAAIEAIAAN